MTDKDQEGTAHEDPEKSGEGVERLSKDEKLAFEKIISEINDSSDTSESHADAADSEPTPPDDLDDEQQAALDKIMAEINGEKNEAPDQEEAQTPQPDSDADAGPEQLDDEQQAALDKIMAEINGEKNEAPDQEEAQTPQPDNDTDAGPEQLDDEQQAALDKIMAEINGDETKSGKTPESASVPESTSVLDKAPTTEATDKSEPDNSPEEEEPSPQTVQLTEEEFNDELNILLAAANKNSPTLKAEDGVPLKDKPTADGRTKDEKVADEEPATDDDTPQEYAILHEIKPDEVLKAASGEKKNRPANPSMKKKRPMKLIYATAVAILVITGIVIGTYWYIFGIGGQSGKLAQLPVKTGESAPAPPPAPNVPKSTPNRTEPSEIEPKAVPPAADSDANPFASLRNDIIAARQQVLRKMEEVKELKAYYEKGIKDGRDKVRRAKADARIVSFKAAQKNRQIELGLRAIQRRSLYAAKLDVPIRQLTSASEELLYLKRKTRMYETLNQGLSGLAIPEFKQEVSVIIANLLKDSNELSIDHIRMDAPTLESLWNDIQSAQKSKPKKQQANQTQDRKISQEICQGNYENKYLLTTLTSETAECLSKWTGKDLYLNGLTELSSKEAGIISQWPGEWLSLNGLKELSGDVAKQLSQWKGKRLSLNGLKRLSKRATQHLSNWNGEQLEMVGLESIGRWENYGTRLYLSEKLRRKLQLQ